MNLSAAKFSYITLAFSLVTLLCIGLLSSSSWAQAEEATTQEQPTPRLNLLERLRQSEPQEAAVGGADEARLERIAARCEASQEKLTAHIQRVEKSKAAHVAVFERLGLRLENLLPRLVASQLETDSLQTIYREFTAQVDQLKNDAGAYETLLSTAATTPCAENPAAYLEQLKQIRASHALILKQHADIKRYARSELMPALTALKEAYKANQEPASTPPREEEPVTNNEGSDS